MIKDIIFKAAQQDIQLDEDECLSIARDLGHISGLLQDFSSIKNRRAFSQFKIWKELVRLKTVRPKTSEAIKRVFGIMLERLDKILGKCARITPKRYFLVNSLLFWFMMPRFQYGDTIKDPLSNVGQLLANFELLLAMKTANREFYGDSNPWCFWRDFSGVFNNYIKCMDSSLRSRYWMALQRDLWLALTKFSGKSDLFFDKSFTYVTTLLDDLSPADICHDYLGLLLDIHGHIINLSRSKISMDYLGMCFNMVADTHHRSFMTERAKLIELIIFRELMHSDQIFYVDKPYFHRIDQYNGDMFDVLTEQTSISLLYSIEKPESWTTCSRGIQSVKFLVLALCRRIIESSSFVKAYHLSLWVELLEHLELAYECRKTQEYPPDKHHLLPTCVELAFKTPFESPESCKHVCEFTYSRDTLNFLERDEARIPEKAKCKELKARLQYYQHEYDRFELCCSSIDRNIDLKFRCVGHDFCPDELGETVCPLLERQFFCDHMGRLQTNLNCSSIIRLIPKQTVIQRREIKLIEV